MKQQGYVALLAVLIMGAVSTAVAIALLSAGADSQRTSLSLQQSQLARGLVTACAEEALQLINDTPSLSGSGNLNLGQGSCAYTIANTGGLNRTVTVSGTVSGTVRRVQVTITIGTTITVNTWQETS